MLSRLQMNKALRLMLATGIGKPVGMNGFPTTAGGLPVLGQFAVLYAIPPSTFSGPPLADGHADVTWTYQVTCVGQREDQVTWLGDKVRTVLLGRNAAGWVTPLVAPGMSVMDREHAGDSPIVSEGELLSYAELFTVRVTPT